MSILNRQEQREEISPAFRTARNMVRKAKDTYNGLVGVFNEGSMSFWQNPRATPQEIAAALGTDGREVFELHAKIGALLAEIDPDAISQGVTIVGTFSYNADGSLTVPATETPVGE